MLFKYSIPSMVSVITFNAVVMNDIVLVLVQCTSFLLPVHACSCSHGVIELDKN